MIQLTCRSLAIALAGAVLALPAALSAQPQDGPKGPAEIIRRGTNARSARELREATTRGGVPAQEPAQDPHAPEPHAPDPQAADPNAANPNAANPHAGMPADAPPPPIASERPDTSLPDGTIRVLVREPSGVPARGAEVSLGIMLADGSRKAESARTNPEGFATFSQLTAGERQAYRVNVPYQGAKYSSNPFKLPPRGGYAVEIRRLAVTRDQKMIVLYVGATSVELKDDRIHVVQQARLLNLGGQTYVFPEKGTLVRLPAGFMAVQSQDSMTDQRIVPAKGEGVRVHGSVPPGEVTLLWGFDVPLAGTEARFAIEVPWLTFAYRVIADAPEGMSLSVAGMPEPLLHADGGRRYLITEMQRKVGDARWQRLEISLRGIPGPGPGRFIAAGLALVVVLGGVVLSRRAAPPQAVAAAAGADLAARKAELLERARTLAALHEAGEVGPQYREEQMTLLETELAALLFEESQRAGTAAAG